MSNELDKSNNLSFSVDASENIFDVVEELPVEIKMEEPSIAFLKEEESIIPAPLDEEVIAKIEQTVQGVGIVNGAIGVAKTVKQEKKKETPKKAKTDKTVAIHSTRNVTWNGVGKVYRGYNIVNQETADKWLTRDHIRLATPQEVAKEYGL